MAASRGRRPAARYALSPTDRARLLINPASARGRGAVRAEDAVAAARHFGVEGRVTASAEWMRREARQAVRDGVERLIVAGGDGSQHLVAQEIAGTETALAPIAAGRGNDFATCVGAPRLWREALERAVERPIGAVDCGRAGDVHFLVHCGVGFDSEAARWANQQRLLRGVLAYPLAALRTMWTYRPVRLRVETPGGLFEDEAMFVVCANCWRFGGGMLIAPQATIDDGLLDVVIARRVSKATMLALLPKVYFGRHVGHPAIETIRTPWARISIDRRLEMHGDGEAMLWVDESPLDVRVLPGALRVVCDDPLPPPPGGIRA